MRVLVVASSIMALLAATQSAAERSHAMVSLENGLTIDFGEPEISGGSGEASGRLFSATAGTVDGAAARAVVDIPGRRYVAYAVRAEILDDGGLARVTIEPLPDVWHQRWRGPAWQRVCPDCPPPTAVPISPTSFPSARDIPIGSEFRLALLESPATGEKVVDVIAVTRQRGPRPGGGLALTNAVLRVNGDELDNTQSCAGEIVYFYLPGTGRFLLSGSPRAGFERGPTAFFWNNVLTLFKDGNSYQIISENLLQPVEPLPATDGSFQIMGNPYLRHEPDWRPQHERMPEPRQYLAGTADATDYPVIPRTGSLPAAASAPAGVSSQARTMPGYGLTVRIEPSQRPANMLREQGPRLRGRDDGAERRVYRCRAVLHDAESGAFLNKFDVGFHSDTQGNLDEPVALADGVTGRLRMKVAVDRKAGTARFSARLLAPDKSVLFSQSADFSIDF